MEVQPLKVLARSKGILGQSIGSDALEVEVFKLTATREYVLPSQLGGEWQVNLLQIVASRESGLSNA